MNEERLNGLVEHITALNAECGRLRGWLLKMEQELAEMQALREQIRCLQAAHHVLWEHRMTAPLA